MLRVSILGDHLDRKYSVANLLREAGVALAELEPAGRGQPPPGAQRIVSGTEYFGTRRCK